MIRLCDEIIQIILNELDDPSSFSILSKRFHQFTQDPYVRSSYFISRYGRIQALFFAMGRGKLINERVIDIMLSSGAHLSRYLAQCAIHHYFRAQVPFIKTPWVRTVPLPTFTHFMTVAARMYGDIPVAKGDDDGSVFAALLKSSRLPSEARPIKWEVLKEVLEKYKFIPFCNKDPMMAQFPLVLAIEPRLLPYARVNGFYMDCKYRNFVFRKMFEKSQIPFDGRANEIARNVRELSRLDPHMFLSRTVAAEICMEARMNEPAYTALKMLDKEGSLKFELSAVIEDLIKLFVNTRSVSLTSTHLVLRDLHADFPSQHPIVRLVLLCTIFFSDGQLVPTSLVASVSTYNALGSYVSQCKEKINNMGLSPLTRKDLFDVLVNKFAPDRFGGILEYARVVVGLDKKEMDELVQDVAIACLEIGCKGKMLKKLVESFDFLADAIASHVLRIYRLDLNDLPPSEDINACRNFEAKLCRDFITVKRPGNPPEGNLGARGPLVLTVNAQEDAIAGQFPDNEDSDEEDEIIAPAEQTDDQDGQDLGPIGQDTLTTMIRKDELAPSRRRRFYDMYASYSDSIGKLTYPADYQQVGRWARTQYGCRSAVAAVFMLHAVLNENTMVLQSYPYNEPYDTATRVPITLKHFKMLARLGRAPNMVLFDDIEHGTEFYFSEEDYITSEELTGNPSSNRGRSRKSIVKMECTIRSEIPFDPLPGPSSSKPRISPRGKRRPRRSAAASVKSYVVPDSDDEEIAGGKSDDHVKKRRVESNLQRWIKHLTLLYKEEQKKYKEKKKREQAAAAPGSKLRVPKSEFFKALATNLPRLRKADQLKRQQLYGADVPSEDYSEGEEDEYQYRTSRAKRRKIDT
ncbi:hypothetical protein AcV7_009642 [Taiwanofungus camphoratus]|nr:hypothetical protein AcV7_009642 [Antrodia cinnamomea]